MMVTLSFLLPRRVSQRRRGIPAAPTLDRVGLGQLGQVGEQVLGDVVPCLALAQAQVDMGTG
jgi:hypothetical protein